MKRAIERFRRVHRLDFYFFSQEIANTEKLRFTNESVAVRAEAAKLKNQGVDIIIVLSHCGLDVDYVIAANAGPDVDVIVGGHSHTFMYTNKTGEAVPGPDTPKDKYPAVVTHEDGHKVLIVQASAYLKYVGDITVYFDQKGRVVYWEGAPIFLDTNVEQGISMVQQHPINHFVTQNFAHRSGNRQSIDTVESNCWRTRQQSGWPAARTTDEATMQLRRMQFGECHRRFVRASLCNG